MFRPGSYSRKTNYVGLMFSVFDWWVFIIISFRIYPMPWRARRSQRNLVYTRWRVDSGTCRRHVQRPGTVSMKDWIGWAQASIRKNRLSLCNCSCNALLFLLLILIPEAGVGVVLTCRVKGSRFPNNKIQGVQTTWNGHIYLHPFKRHPLAGGVCYYMFNISRICIIGGATI